MRCDCGKLAEVSVSDAEGRTRRVCFACARRWLELVVTDYEGANLGALCVRATNCA